MKLFSRDKNQNVPADLEPYAAGANDWRVWVRRIVAAVVLVALVAAIVWAGVKVYNSVTEDETATTKPADQTVKESDNKQKSDTKDTSKDSKDKSSQPTQNTGAPAATSAPLPKTGDDAAAQPAVLPATGG